MSELLPQNFQWAAALKKAQQETKRKRALPVPQRKIALTKRLEQTGEALENALQKKDIKALQSLYTDFLKLRAEQTAILLEQLSEQYRVVPQTIVRTHAEQYQKDCLELAAMIDLRLEKQTAQ